MPALIMSRTEIVMDYDEKLQEVVIRKGWNERQNVSKVSEARTADFTGS